MTLPESQEPNALPGTDLDVSKMPAHWLLARLGKRVLRPGGLWGTRTLLESLAIGPADDVVEFAPGLGGTARMILEHTPHSYTGVERDAQAAQWTRRHLPPQPSVSVVVGAADRTELADASVSVVLGEAMLDHEYPGAQATHYCRGASLAATWRSLRYSRVMSRSRRHLLGKA